MSRSPILREQYRYFVEIPTRWSDNDMFGHINNVEYYRFFEAIIVGFFSERAKYDLMTSPIVTFAAESQCRYRRPLSFPEVIEGAFRIDHIGRTSVRYGMALFSRDVEDAAAAGHWVHVFVDRETQKPHPIPDGVRLAFERALVAPG